MDLLGFLNMNLLMGHNGDLDLYTLEEIKSMFDYYSDYSTKCFGYENLCTAIENTKKYLEENNEDIQEKES